MAKRAEDIERDPAVVPIPDVPTRSMDEWLASLKSDEPIDLPVPAAELVAEERDAQD